MPRIEVTKDLNARGVRGSCWRCPVALALANSGYPMATVSPREIKCSDRRIDAPPAVAAFVRAFDNGDDPGPFGFDVPPLDQWECIGVRGEGAEG